MYRAARVAKEGEKLDAEEDEPDESDSSEEAVEPLSVSLGANVWDGTGEVARSGWSGSPRVIV